MRERRTKIVVEGVNQAGEYFHPSDWIDRLCTVFSEFGPDHRLHYAKGVHPLYMNDDKFLVVEPDVKSENPSLYEYIMEFVAANDLRWREEPV